MDDDFVFYSLQYVSRETMKRGKTKDKSSYILMSRREEQQPSVDNSAPIASAMGKEALEDDFGMLSCCVQLSLRKHSVNSNVS